MNPKTLVRPDTALLARIVDRAFAQTMMMIHVANHRPEKRRGDPKVGGHPASCASSMHLLGALHLYAREVHDYIACKPHASPVDHTYHHLMQVFRRDLEATSWHTPEESKAIMTRDPKLKAPTRRPGSCAMTPRTVNGWPPMSSESPTSIPSCVSNSGRTSAPRFATRSCE